MVTALLVSKGMTNQTPITPTICLRAPDAIADMILRRRILLLKERCPNITLRVNPSKAIPQSAQIQLGFEDVGSADIKCRKIGKITSRTYVHRRFKDLRVLPDMIAGLDRDYDLQEADQNPIIDELYLSFDADLLHVPGIRQTLDWVESCVASLFWLNDDAAA